ncbi:MAG: hypothetical protein JXQ99_16160 [Hyphomicrobiaceae bacterium]
MPKDLDKLINSTSDILSKATKSAAPRNSELKRAGGLFVVKLANEAERELIAKTQGDLGSATERLLETAFEPANPTIEKAAKSAIARLGLTKAYEGKFQTRISSAKHERTQKC